MVHEKSCGAIVIDGRNVLVIKHKAGHWDFPKGHVENDETEKETAIREVKEETNIDIVVDERYRYMVTYSPKENTIKDVIFYLAKPLNKNYIPQLSEISEIKWLDIDEVIDVLTFNNSKNMFNQLLIDINEN